MRFGEAQALDWDNDLDFQNQTLKVSKSIYYKNVNKFDLTVPKIKASNRIITLDYYTIKF
ncbi:site-specific recombinase phage integrase family [Bacillus cereus]|nr:site-specific recombinase phage integrase family [Bacillus cereus]